MVEHKVDFNNCYTNICVHEVHFVIVVRGKLLTCLTGFVTYFVPFSGIVPMAIWVMPPDLRIAGDRGSACKRSPRHCVNR